MQNLPIFDIATAPRERVFAHTDNHLYLAPCAALRQLVAHYTITFPSPSPPSGTAPPLVLVPDLGGCFVFSMGGPKEDFFWGAATKAIEVQRDFNDVPMRFFVEFLPGGANRILGFPMKELADRRLVLADVVPHLHARLSEVLYSGCPLPKLLEMVEGLLLGELYARSGHPSAAALLPLLGTLPASAPVRKLAGITGYSERQLGRIFSESVGLGVKATTRVIRINSLMKLLVPGVSIADVAQQAGYHDQAHMNHDFKAVFGVSPTEYLSNMSDFYKEEYKF